MYSLYRAWFGGEDNYARLETLSPPDTLIRVGNEGEYQFVAHRGVLAAHSGYLKALLATAANSNASATSGGNGVASTVTSVSVSSIGKYNSLKVFTSYIKLIKRLSALLQVSRLIF